MPDTRVTLEKLLKLVSSLCARAAMLFIAAVATAICVDRLNVHIVTRRCGGGVDVLGALQVCVLVGATVFFR